MLNFINIFLLDYSLNIKNNTDGNNKLHYGYTSDK